MYFCFSSSFICSARSAPPGGGPLFWFGVPELEVTADAACNFDLAVVVGLSPEPGPTRGESAIVGFFKIEFPIFQGGKLGH